ncbi:MAG TPA: hypothetical protein VN737_16235 [Bryobacteraceae bacterium]|nr:hypothetical protein [Bryobacteraceae bacterium]
MLFDRREKYIGVEYSKRLNLCCDVVGPQQENTRACKQGCRFAFLELMRNDASVWRVALFLTFAAGVHSQTRAAPATLDFVAETPDHQPVLDLRADEIVLKEDGVVQPLKGFGAPTGSELQTRRPKSAHGEGAMAVLLDASSFLASTMMRPAPGSPPGPGSHVSLNSHAEAVKSTAISLVKNLSIESPVAVYVSNLDLRIIQDFADRPDSSAIVKNSSANVNKALSVFDKMPILNPTKIHSIRITGAEEFELAQIESIADHMANLPGRKAVIWYCDGVQPGPKFLDRINLRAMRGFRC